MDCKKEKVRPKIRIEPRVRLRPGLRIQSDAEVKIGCAIAIDYVVKVQYSRFQKEKVVTTLQPPSCNPSTSFTLLSTAILDRIRNGSCKGATLIRPPEVTARRAMRGSESSILGMSKEGHGGWILDEEWLTSDAPSTLEPKSAETQLQRRCSFQRGRQQIGQKRKLEPRLKRGRPIPPEVQQSSTEVKSRPWKKARDLVKCPECESQFTAKTKLKSHLRIHARPFKCENCSYRFPDRLQLTRHRYRHTGNICNLCAKAFSKRPLLLTHMRSHTGRKSFVCPLCKRRFADRSGLFRHQKRHNPFSWTHCQKQFLNQGGLLEHARIHLDSKKTPHSCEK